MYVEQEPFDESGLVSKIIMIRKLEFITTHFGH